MSRRIGACFLLAGLLTQATALARQDQEMEGGGMMVIGPDGRPMMVGPQGTPPDGAAAQPETERAKKLKTLVFDRRPSTILETWSKPPEPEMPPKTDAAAKTDAPAQTDAPAAPPAETASSTPPAPEPAPIPPDETEEARKAREAAAAAAAAAAAKAAEDAAKAKAEAEKKAEEQKQLDREMKQFQRMVTLGEWDAVAAYLKGITPAEAKVGYMQLLRSLQQPPPPKPGLNPQMQQWLEKHQITVFDLVGLARAAPVELDKEMEKPLGMLLSQSLAAGSVLERFLELARVELARDGSPVKRRNVARLLMAANQPESAVEFLPAPDEAVAAGDREGLNLLSRHYLAMQKKEQKGGWLEKAWGVTLSALQAGTITEDDKKEALKLAVEIAPKVREELGQVWLDESFTARPERGMEILAAIGASASEGLVRLPQDADARLRGLKLQTTATESLLKASPRLGAQWARELELLATNWLREAVFSNQYDRSTRRGPRLQRDYYGNFFYYDENYYPQQGNQMPAAIPVGKLLEVTPSSRWLDHVDAGMRPKFAMLCAQLFLKMGEEGEAFPHIERLASTHPRQAKDLCEEFLRVWTRNHNPNEASSRTNSYVYFYGFEQRANGIPLTRSKQDRNLAELAGWVKRLAALPVERLDESLLADAFTNAHSSAEVYRLEAIEGVFGSLEKLEPTTLARLIERMRTNLVSVWRRPDVQKDKKTNRQQKDIQAEVLRGYEVARGVIAEARARRPDEWHLALAQASLEHDENNYRADLEKSADFSARRRAAFDSFAAAADLYVKAQPALTVDEESADAWLTWYYAALGACDLAAVDEDKVVAVDQIERIRGSLEAVGGADAEAVKRHRTKFASTLFTRMSNVNPAVKYRYVRAGLEIVGDDEAASEAREVYDYYKDLVTEITIDAHVDGSAVVGHDRPFGLFVDLRHTREIEREAGGFGKYLTNQNNQSFSWNYGRPTENYRERFEEAAREALKEHFEVRSITFNHPETASKAEPEYGWRRTPYCYLLLQPRGPEVDKVPSLRLDLDFLDTSGYVVLPVESPPVVIDARTPGEARPFEGVQLTQTLDERQAAQGRLVLEVQAKGRGLLPGLEELLDLRPDGFDVTKIDDQGASVTEYDKEADSTALLCERTWMVTLEGRKDLATLPETFTFGTPRIAGAKVEYQRFVDADLAKAEPTITLERQYGTKRAVWPRVLGWSAAGLVLLAGAIVLLRRKPRPVEAGRFQRPAEVTPFTALALLREMERDGAFRDGAHQELVTQIDRIERHYFAQDGNGSAAADGSPDLDAVVDGWLRRAP